MELSTRGIKFYPEYAYRACFVEDETFPPERQTGDRLRLVLVEKGLGLLNLSGQRLAFSAPALMLLNEQENPSLENSSGFQARTFYFHPGIINSAFTFESIREEPGEANPDTLEDRSSLQPFVTRGNGFTGLLPLGPESTRRAAQLFDAIRRQLVDQPDDYWVCRSRSFLLELLTLVQQLVATPEHTGANMIQTEETSAALTRVTEFDIERVILYLHAHYNEKITLPALADLFHTSRANLEERFQQTTQFSVMTYLTHLRMRQASLMLRDTALPIAEIMLRVGYRQTAQFVKSFRTHTGISPVQYRRRYCWLMRPL